eukprot:Skav235105  [mRNA]  locus=scaffold711:251545:251808:- [translate_table: standard]
MSWISRAPQKPAGMSMVHKYPRPSSRFRYFSANARSFVVDWNCLKRTIRSKREASRSFCMFNGTGLCVSPFQTLPPLCNLLEPSSGL